MSTDQALGIAIGLAWPGVMIAFAAKTLPLIQWTAGLCAIIVSSIAIYKFIKEHKG